jgi:fluoride exporter
MLSYLCIGLGSALGGMLRYWISGLVAERYGESFPLGTLIVNVSGSFLIGFLATLTAPDGRWLMAPLARQFFMIGLLGGYTTFSSFSLQTLNLIRDGEWLYAGLNSILSLALCLIAVWLGYAAAAGINSIKGP